MPSVHHYLDSLRQCLDERLANEIQTYSDYFDTFANEYYKQAQDAYYNELENEGPKDNDSRRADAGSEPGNQVPGREESDASSPVGVEKEEPDTVPEGSGERNDDVPVPEAASERGSELPAGESAVKPAGKGVFDWKAIHTLQ